MKLPAAIESLPFNITRASHVVLSSKDIVASREFYSEVLGFVVSDETDEALYLRGLEERSHHSIVLMKDGGSPSCASVGFRVASAKDLELLAHYFESKGLTTEWPDRAHQERTLRTVDPLGTPLEFCSAMEEAEPKLQRFHEFRRGCPMRLDHFQIVSQDVEQAAAFYSELGFRLTEYTSSDDGADMWGAWLARKGNPHDVVFSNGRGPRLHHFAFTVPEVRDVIHACDAAASLGFGATLERGPGRHGIGNALFVYFRDPDGHRVELFVGHYQAIDGDPPLRWLLSDTRRSQLWGLPATSRWFFEATEFSSKRPQDPRLTLSPITLEAVLAGDR